MAKSLEQLIAEASAPVAPKGTRKKRVKTEVVEVAAEPVPGIELGSSVAVRRAITAEAGRRIIAGTVGKVTKLHDDLPDWFTVAFGSVEANLHRNDLTLQ